MTTKKEILAFLPKGFECSIPKKSHVVYLRACPKQINAEDANKVEELCKAKGLECVHVHSSEEAIDWMLRDKAFEKKMNDDARACLKTLKSFFSKYNEAYRFSNTACDAVRDIIDVIDNR